MSDAEQTGGLLDLSDGQAATLRKIARGLAWMVLAAGLLGAFVAGSYAAILYRGLFGGVLLILMALLGFVFLPICAYGLPLGRTGGEAIGNALFKLATLPGTGTMAINQRADDVFEWVSIDDEDAVHGSRRWWARFVGRRFGLTYDRTAEAFGDLAQTREEIVEQHGADPAHLADGGDAIALDSERGGSGQFLALDGPAGAIYIHAAEKLNELQEAAGLDVGVRARANGLVEYGGDTSDVSPWAMLAGSFLFLLAGAGLGILILG